jgi:hypothetical protein
MKRKFNEPSNNVKFRDKRRKIQVETLFSPVNVDDFGPVRKDSVMAIYCFLHFGTLDYLLHGEQHFASNTPCLFIHCDQAGVGISSSIDYCADRTKHEVYRYTTQTVHDRGFEQCMEEWINISRRDYVHEIGFSPIQSGGVFGRLKVKSLFGDQQHQNNNNEKKYNGVKFRLLVLENVDSYIFNTKDSIPSTTHVKKEIIKLVQTSKIPIIITCTDVYKGLSKGKWRWAIQTPSIQSSLKSKKCIHINKDQLAKMTNEQKYNDWNRSYRNYWQILQFRPLPVQSLKCILVEKSTFGVNKNNRTVFNQLSGESMGNVRWALNQLNYYEKTDSYGLGGGSFQDRIIDRVENQFTSFNCLVGLDNKTNNTNNPSLSFENRLVCIHDHLNRNEMLLYGNLYQCLVPRNLGQNQMGCYADTLDDLSLIDSIGHQWNSDYSSTVLYGSVYKGFRPGKLMKNVNWSVGQMACPKHVKTDQFLWKGDDQYHRISSMMYEPIRRQILSGKPTITERRGIYSGINYLMHYAADQIMNEFLNNPNGEIVPTNKTNKTQTLRLVQRKDIVERKRWLKELIIPRLKEFGMSQKKFTERFLTNTGKFRKSRFDENSNVKKFVFDPNFKRLITNVTKELNE